jgi:hypothetical protein
LDAEFPTRSGNDVRSSVVYQDNKSAILLEQNGRGSSSKRTRHIDIRYFFITDRIAGKEVSVEYCPTGEMVSDFFTKPLQGALFRKLRGLIMNNDHVIIDDEDRRSVLDKPVQSPRQATQGLRMTTVPRETGVSARGPIVYQTCDYSNPVGWTATLIIINLCVYARLSYSSLSSSFFLLIAALVQGTWWHGIR